jgi:hypothetical protein
LEGQFVLALPLVLVAALLALTALLAAGDVDGGADGPPDDALLLQAVIRSAAPIGATATHVLRLIR